MLIYTYIYVHIYIVVKSGNSISLTKIFLRLKVHLCNFQTV